MYIGEEFAGKIFVDALKNIEDEILINNDGCGIFKVKSKSTSIWITK